MVSWSIPSYTNKWLGPDQLFDTVFGPELVELKEKSDHQHQNRKRRSSCSRKHEAGWKQHSEARPIRTKTMEESGGYTGGVREDASDSLSKGIYCVTLYLQEVETQQINLSVQSCGGRSHNVHKHCSDWLLTQNIINKQELQQELQSINQSVCQSPKN